MYNIEHVSSTVNEPEISNEEGLEAGFPDFQELDWSEYDQCDYDDMAQEPGMPEA